jgi:PAS domain S-box-containing protein
MPELRRTLRTANAAERLTLLSRAVEQSPVSIIITDAAGVIAYVNPHFTRVTGYGADEVIGRTPSILKSGEQDQAFYRDLWDTITDGREWRGELRNRRKDGSLFTELALISPVVDESGRATHFIAIKEDVTTQRHLEDQLRQAQRLEAVGQLAGGIAHDFNNMLTVIAGFSALLEPVVAGDEEARRHLAEVQKAAARSASLTRQLLAFGRRQVLRPERIELNELVHGLTVMLERLVGTHIDLDVRLAPTPLLVSADRSQLEQVLVNLCVNARDAMPDRGTLTIRTTAADGHVRLVVEDTGTGIDPEVMPRIFEPFFTTKGVGRGTGLGLATVHGIVSQSGGDVAVDSEVGRGTRFTITLPVPVGPGPERTGRRSTLRPRGTETILVVEDERSVRALVSGILRMHGYEVIEAEDGAEGVRVASAERRHIHLVITDVAMPKLNGWETAACIRSARPHTRVLFMSGYTDDTVRRQGVLPDDHTFLNKPFEPTTLLQAVREVLDDPASDTSAI